MSPSSVRQTLETHDRVEKGDVEEEKVKKVSIRVSFQLYTSLLILNQWFHLTGIIIF